MDELLIDGIKFVANGFAEQHIMTIVSNIHDLGDPPYLLKESSRGGEPNKLIGVATKEIKECVGDSGFQEAHSGCPASVLSASDSQQVAIQDAECRVNVGRGRPMVRG